MTPEELATRHPLLYHMAALGSWPNVQKHGLLSTSATLDLFGITRDERFRLESQWRPTTETLTDSIQGQVVIRDQIPMREDELQKCLEGLTTRQWYELINHKTFFWVDRQRLEWMLGARQYRNSSHHVLTVDTGSLLSGYSDRVTLSDLNSGSV